MSNQQHTPEPWGIRCHTCATPLDIGAGDDYTIDGADGTPVGFEPQRRNQRVGADARRIVACVNACADIPTASLEGMEVGHLNSIHRQRDELLQVVIGAIECNYFPDLADPCLKSKALAAITKATGST